MADVAVVKDENSGNIMHENTEEVGIISELNKFSLLQ